MLNQRRVLDFIKDNLGFPFQQLELEDDKIIEYFTTYTLREFSYYIPEIKRMNLNVLSAASQHETRSNEFYLEEPDGLEILNVTEVYFDLGQLIIHGHAPLGPLTHGELKEFALSTTMAMDVKMHSSYDRTYEFMHPNVLRISPAPSNVGNVTVEYERQQPADLRGVPNDLQMYFCEFAKADIMIILGRIRKKYGDGVLRTPFGEIPLNSDIYEEGKELKATLIERFKETYLPNVTIEIG
ncbi:hypothetical protein KAR91_24995 [Candidatus Pacearchaeota archaeon]|nr:hypothetical protein [Candidatus Pacearchaeota archaeon]